MSITTTLVIIISIISIYAFSNPELINKYKHFPYYESKRNEYYRMITSGFLHGGWMHLIINMFVLYEFGRIAEGMYKQLFGVQNGSILYVVLFFLTIVVADLPTYFKYRNNPGYASIGASGAVSGIVFIFILIAPWEMLYLYGIIPIPAIMGGVAYLGYSQWAANNSNSNVDHDAHLYGALFGMLFTIILAPRLLGHFWEQLISVNIF